VDFIVGTFLEPSNELKAKGFIGYNASLIESNLWQAYTFNVESGEQHNFFRYLNGLLFSTGATILTITFTFMMLTKEFTL